MSFLDYRPASDRAAANWVGSRTLLWTGLLTLFAVVGPVTQVQAQPAYLAPEDYGKAELPIRQSIGSAVAFVKKNGHAFEPVSQLRTDDSLYRLARAVGRLDLLIEEGGKLKTSVCTAVLISDTHVLTNHHCIGDKKYNIKKASMLFDYLKQNGDGAFRVKVSTKPVQADERLDYAIVLLGKRVNGIAPMPLMAKRIEPKARLRIIHHPAGLPKMITEFKCKVANSHQPNGTYIRHVCDTFSGSSGAVIMDPETSAMVGLHHRGGLTANDPTSYNLGTTVLSLASHSSIIRSIARRAPTLASGRPIPVKASTQVSPASRASKNEEAGGGAASINRLIKQEKGN